MPPFRRTSWVSAEAKNLWEPRIAMITKAIESAEIERVRIGGRKCVFIDVDCADLPPLSLNLVQEGLLCIPIQSANSQRGRSDGTTCAILRVDYVNSFAFALENDDLATLCSLLGMGICCQDAYINNLEEGISDATWISALNSAPSDPATHRVELKPGIGTNTLLRSMGLRLVSHIPCRFDCEHSHREQADNLEALLTLGRRREADWLTELLDMPLSWTSLHGIAEIKTPLFRLSLSTDPVATKLSVVFTGKSYPTHSHLGVSFPFIVPNRRKYTESRAYLKGLNQLRQIADSSAKV